MTEAYRYRYGHGHDYPEELKRTLAEAGRPIEPNRFVTSPEVLAEGNSFAAGNIFDDELDYEWEFLTDSQKERRPRFVALYNDLLAGKMPTLRELHDLLVDDRVTAAAYEVIDQIHKHWIPSPEARHRRWMEERDNG